LKNPPDFSFEKFGGFFYATQRTIPSEDILAEDAALGRRVGAQKFLVHTPPRNSSATGSKKCNVVYNSLL